MKEISPVSTLDTTVEAPPSKAHTLRSFFLGATATGTTTIQHPLMAEDQRAAISALRDLGADITVSDDETEVSIEGCDGCFTAPDHPVHIEESGTSARISTALCSLADGTVELDGSERMREARPVGDLLDALESLGVEAQSLNSNGCLPITIGGNFEGGTTNLNGSKSSQFFSAILMAAPYADEDITIETIGEISSKPYIDITIDMMDEFGVAATHNNYEEFTVESGQKYQSQNYHVEGDYSNAAYFFAAAAVTGGTVGVTNLNPNSSQGDKVFVDLLDEMGCDVTKQGTTIEITGRPLKGIEADMNKYPDIVLPLSVVAAFADGESRLYNIGHLKYKESNRIKAPVTELQKMGVDATATDDAIIVNGGTPEGAAIDTYNDHRMAMSFAIAGLATPGVTIKTPDVVQKSFPDFFDVLESNFTEKVVG